MYILDALQTALSFLQQSTDPNRFNDFMLLGYGVMWIVAMVYIASLANRQRNVREEIKLLRRLLKDDEESQNR